MRCEKGGEGKWEEGGRKSYRFQNAKNESSVVRLAVKSGGTPTCIW